MHILKTGTTAWKVGGVVFRCRDKFIYLTTSFGTTSNSTRRICYDLITANNRLFVTNNGPGTLSVVNATTFAIVATITGLSSIQAVSIDTSTNTIYACGGSNIWVINGSTYSIITTITGFTDLRGIAVDPVSANHRAFVCDFSTSIIYIINTSTNTSASSFAASTQPFGIDFDPVAANNRLAVSYLSGSIKFLDATSFSILGTATGLGVPCQVTFDPVAINNRALTTNLDGGTVSGINLGTYANTGVMPGANFSSAYGIAFDPIAFNNRFIIADQNASTLQVVTQTAV